MLCLRLQADVRRGQQPRQPHHREQGGGAEGWRDVRRGGQDAHRPALFSAVWEVGSVCV